MIIEYINIKAEFKRLGLTNKRVANILGISVQGLDKRIKQNKPSIHLITFALTKHFSEDERNLVEE